MLVKGGMIAMQYFYTLDICVWLWFGWAVVWALSAPFTRKQSYKETYLQRQTHGLPSAIAVMCIFFVPLFDLPRVAGRLYSTSGAQDLCGIALTFAGLCFAIWARFHLGRYWSGTVALKQDHKIVDTGPYHLIRHPIYTGIIAACFGSAFVAATLPGFAGVPLITIAFIVKLRREEALMRQHFGQEYSDYMKRTAALLPGLY